MKRDIEETPSSATILGAWKLIYAHLNLGKETSNTLLDVHRLLRVIIDPGPQANTPLNNEQMNKVMGFNLLRGMSWEEADVVNKETIHTLALRKLACEIWTNRTAR